ncbi:TATA-binding protein-associated factor 2N [Quillaja saponaria]|uniref:TATA-binding protein-associated factor 2N n=1 Tax=Quillaja saponaria TaxID=32244 RepID=A0AAD7M4D6_QUISA|nr:TATA-binding protein-associated factor 2N [Quillaja saponaria]
MGSRDSNQTTRHHHQPLLSSLVVRPSNSDGGAGIGAGGGNGGRGSDYEPGEVRRDPPPYSRSGRYSDDPGYRTRAGSGSPIHRRAADHRYNSDHNHSDGLSRSRVYGSGRDPGRYRDSSPSYGRGRVGRPVGRAFDGPDFGPGPFRGDGMNRNNPNVRPREGDWICADPSCGNLNFARREHCNNCHKSRNGPGGSPRRGYTGPPPLHAPPRRFPGPPVDCSPERTINGFRSPPRGWARDGPREFRASGLPPLRHEGRFSDHHMRRDRFDYLEDDHRGRNKFDRPQPVDWSQRDHGRDGFPSERKGFEGRPLSSPPPAAAAPLPPHRGRWARDIRERSRSPIRGVVPPPKEYRRDLYMGRGRDDRHAVGRDRIGGIY